MFLPEFTKGDGGCVGNFETSLEEMHGVQFLEVENNLLVHRLEERGGVWWKIQNLDE